MLTEQRENVFYEYCDAFGVSNDIMYITEAEEGLFTKIKKAIQDLIKKIHDFLFGEKIKKLDMNEKVKVDKNKLKKAKTFSARIKNLSKYDKIKVASVITGICGIGLLVYSTKKDQKKFYGTCKRSELKKLLKDLDDNLNHVDDMVDSMEDAWKRQNPNATEEQKKEFAKRKEKEKKRLTNEMKKDRKALKERSSVIRTTIGAYRDLIKIIGNVIAWVMIHLTGNGTEIGEGYKVTHKRGEVDRLEAFDKYGDKKPVDEQTLKRALRDGAIRTKAKKNDSTII